MDNIITATFNDYTYARTTSLWQYDYGQILQIEGITLPATFEVHFSDQDQEGESLIQIGAVKDKAAQVQIPDSFLWKAAGGNYSIYAFIYLTDTESGETKYKITIPVRARPKPNTDFVDTPEEKKFFREAIEEVNNVADQVETSRAAVELAQQKIETVQTDVQQLHSNTAQSAESAKTSADNAARSAKSIKDASKQFEQIKKDVTSLKEEIANIRYTPIEILSFSNNVNIAELGSTVNEISLTWKLNKIPRSATLNNVSVSGELKADQSVTIIDAALTTDSIFTLAVTDEKNKTVQKKSSIAFYNGVYYGCAIIPTKLDSVFVRGLNKSLQKDQVKTFTVNSGVNQYVWYALPTRYGEAVFNVGGFDGGFTKISEISFENSSGYTEEYAVYRSDYSNLGKKTVKVI
nr:MAG TPA: hypothetical protein [Caudoviricetes sp.]